MADDPHESAYARRVRDMQNWIGGSDHSPRGALYVPPPPDRVEPLLDDLVVWTNRDDMPALVHAAIAHAQFESIHPFTDRNGRIGRALISRCSDAEASHASAAAYAAIDRLTDAGVISEITGRKRDRAWAAMDVLGELDRRIQRAMGRFGPRPITSR